MKRFLSLFLSIAGVLAMAAGVPANYYSSLDGKNKGALKDAAKKVVRNHTVVEYGTDTWEAFASTDVKVVGGVEYWWDMYSNNLVKVYDGNQINHDGMNIEHSVSNSWWGKTKNDAYKDLFHLNPTEAGANNRKSNYPLGIVIDPSYDNGVTRVGKPASGDCGGARNVYEPCEDYKGDFARAFMYIFTVYDDIAWSTSMDDRNFMFDGSAYPSFKPWAYKMLLEWSRKDPVSDKERERNEAVYKIQKNRNPFIDLPELAEYIWGDKQNQTFSVAGGDDIEDPEDPEDPEEPALNPMGDGSKENPYNVDFVLGNTAEIKGVWLKGYIVGYVDGYTYNTGVTFSNVIGEGMSYTNTNILIAADKECKDPSLCVPVQLPKGSARDDLGLGKNPSAYLKEVLLYGDLISYFGVPGHQNLSEYELETDNGIETLMPDTGIFTACNTEDGIKIITDRLRRDVAIYSMSGLLFWEADTVSGGETVSLPTGMYILTAKGLPPVKLILR